ncbi:MAG: efflux RND transporter periplasmic adaptor subunit [Gammaproteobacteria bacterium]|nr:efflux RND transporter periplasmic adaptor subunit [Gammaproteobacteria bacterium]
MTETTKTTYKPRILPFLILGIIILCIAIGITVKWIDQVEPKKPRPVVEKLPFVTLQTVNLSDNQATFSSGGFVSAKYASRLSAEVSGQVLSVSSKFIVGNTVKKGDTLATIDNKNYVAALANAKANLATAKSHYAQEQARSRQARRDAKGLGVKTSSLLLRKPQIAAAKSSVENATAQLNLARQNLAKTVIKAPFDAVIQSRQIAVGDSVMGSSVVAQLVATDTFTVKLNLNSFLFNLVDIGSRVTLTDTISGVQYNATISRFAPSIDKTTRTVGAYVDIQQPLSGKKPLLLDSYLQAEIIGKTIPNSMWIDNQASVENQFVWIKDAENRLQKVPFTLIYRDKKRSLVQFDNTVTSFITNPKDSFFVGEKVTTERPQTSPKSQSKAKSKIDESKGESRG